MSAAIAVMGVGFDAGMLGIGVLILLVSPGDGRWRSFRFFFFARRFSFSVISLDPQVVGYVCTSTIMAPSNDVVYRSHSTAEREDSIEKPTFKDGDKALEFLRSEAEEGETDLIDEKQLVRKIDFMIV